jgi:hypothetical protein
MAILLFTKILKLKGALEADRSNVPKGLLSDLEPSRALLFFILTLLEAAD